MRAIILPLLLSACAPAMDSMLSHINLRFVNSAVTSATTSGSTLLSSANTPQPNTEVALSSSYCYAIMVSAEDTPTLNRYKDYTTNMQFKGAAKCNKYMPHFIGQMNGLYSLGAKADLRAPMGRARQFHVLMAPKGTKGVPDDCQGVIDLKYLAGKPSVLLNGNLIDIDMKLLAFGVADLRLPTTTVDLQLLSGSQGTNLGCSDY